MAKKRNFRLGYDPATQIQLHLMMLPGTILIILFNIVPLFGLLLAFKNYKVTDGIAGIFTSPWYGFQNFKIIFANHDFGRMMVNTLGINLIGQLITIPLTIGLALMMNEIRNVKFRYAVQTVTYMPHFISVVILVGMLTTFLSPRSGFLSQILTFFGASEEAFYMGDAKAFPHLYVWSGIWQDMGWSSIIYLAALAGVDQSLHEAAKVDGATKLQRIWHVDLPAIVPTMVILLIMSVGSVMSVGYEKVFLMQNNLNITASEVISTYVYKIGLQQQQYSYSAAIGLFNNGINFILLVVVNQVSKKLSGSSLW